MRKSREAKVALFDYYRWQKHLGQTRLEEMIKQEVPWDDIVRARLRQNLLGACEQILGRVLDVEKSSKRPVFGYSQPYRLPTVLHVFPVRRDQWLYAYHLSCGHTVMYGHTQTSSCHEWEQAHSRGRKIRCYRKHDVHGKALSAQHDPQQEADEAYFAECGQCWMCGGVDAHSLSCQKHEQGFVNLCAIGSESD